MGIVRAAQKGTLPKGKTSPEVQRAASSMKKKDVKKFASTKHKGLPERKKVKVNEDAKMAKQSDDKLKAAHKKFSGMDKSPANTFMLKRIQREMNKRKKNLKYSMKEDYVKVKESAELKKANINYKTTKKGGKTTYHVNKNDEADAQKAMKNDPKYILGKTRVKPVKEAKENPIKIDDLKKTVPPNATKGQMLDQVRKKQKEIQSNVKEDYVKELEDGLVKLDYPTYDEVDDLMKKIAKDNNIDTTVLHMAFKTKHLMVPDDWAKKKMLEPVMIPKTPKDMECEENLLEYDGNYHMNKIAKEKGLDLTDPRQRRRANSLARKNAAKGNVNNPAGFSMRKKRTKMQTEGNLRDWFKGSKSKDGKGGWVNVVTGGTCASDEPGEGTPKCVSSKKRASMTKAERLSAQRRKKAADPGQQSKKNAAKPTYVSTDSPKKKKKMSEGITYINPNNNRNDMGAPKGMKSTTPPKPKEKKLTKPPYENLAAEYAPKGEGLDERLGGKGVSKKAAAGSIYPGKKGDGDYPDSDRGAGNKAMRRSGGKVEAKSPTFLAYLKNKKNKMNEAKKVRRDEYGDIIGGPPISDKQRAKNLAKNEKDEKIVRSEAYSSRPSNVKKKAKLNAALKRLEDMKVASKMKKEEVEQINEFKKSPAWQRKAGKSESGGLNAKGVASYRAANPGSKLKTAVTTKPSKLKKGSKSAKRRLSFCRRMKGMKKKLTSAKTARDPDSRINKALRKWNCSFEPEHGEVISEGKVAKMVKSLRRKTKVLEKGQKKGRDAGAIAAKIMRDKEHNKYVSFLPAPTNEEKEIPANVKKIAKELDKAVAMHKSQAQRLRKAGISEGKKKCGEGEYYCNDMKKCRPIPKGYRVGYGGMLKPENEKDESNGKKGGSNGNGNGHGGNGNGHGGNGNGGNGGGGNGGGE